jgi:hypothetical protein
VACMSVAAVTCLPSRCYVTDYMATHFRRHKLHMVRNSSPFTSLISRVTQQNSNKFDVGNPGAFVLVNLMLPKYNPTNLLSNEAGNKTHGAELFLRNFRNSTELENSTRCLQQSDTCYHSEQTYSGRNPSPHSYKICYNIVLLSGPGSPKWPLSFPFSDQKYLRISLPLYACCMPRPIHSP